MEGNQFEGFVSLYFFSLLICLCVLFWTHILTNFFYMFKIKSKQN